MPQAKNTKPGTWVTDEAGYHGRLVKKPVQAVGRDWPYHVVMADGEKMGVRRDEHLERCPQGNRLQVSSLDDPLNIHHGELEVGCQRITEADMLLIFKWLAPHVGYDVEE